MRDKNKREVDFIIVKDDEPWMLVEVKTSSNKKVSKSLHYFSELLEVPQAVQVAFDLPFVEADCFALSEPMVVPVTTFLSQLV